MKAAVSPIAACSGILLATLLVAGCGREQSTPAGAGGSQASQAASAPSAATASASASASSPASAGASAAPASAPRADAAPLVPTQVPVVLVSGGDEVTAGQQLAAQGAGGAAACSGCHGANGEGNPQTGFPRLAGLGRPYIEHQLNSYADGTRANPIMSPIASALNAAQRSAAAAYYGSLGSASSATRANNATSGSAAPVLAVRGDESKGIQSCANCHGPQGIGDAAANPYLAGQNATYLANALAAWKSGTRHNDPSGQMPAIAKALGDADVKALVAYFSALPPPAAGNAQAAMVASAGNSPRTEVRSGPVAATAPSRGTGTELGAPLTGGAQSQGSGGAATNPAQSTPSKP
jgi:cytochrome c553